MAVHHGRFGRMFLSTTAGGVAIAVAKLNNWTLDESVDTAEVSSFGDSNKIYVQGLKDAKGAFSGFWDDTDTTIWVAVDSTAALKMYLYPDFTASPGSYWYGYAWISASIETPIGGPVAIKGSWVAGSVITKIG